MLRLLDAGAAAAAAADAARTGVSLHDGLLAEASSLQLARMRAIAAANDADMVRIGACTCSRVKHIHWQAVMPVFVSTAACRMHAGPSPGATGRARSHCRTV